MSTRQLALVVKDLDQIIKNKQELKAEKIRRLEDLKSLTEMMTVQAAAIDKELKKTIDKLKDISLTLEKLKQALKEDETRAEKLRSHELASLKLQAEQCRAELQGVKEILNIEAPFSGRVVYRETSPQTAYNKAPLLVLAKGDAFF